MRISSIQLSIKAIEVSISSDDGGAQLRIQLLVEGMMIKVAREGVRTFDDCFAKVSAS